MTNSEDSNQKKAESEVKREKKPFSNTTDILVSEKLFGLNFTPEKRELMIENIDDYYESYIKNRKANIASTTPPAFTFSPQVVGLEYPVRKLNESDILKISDNIKIKIKPANLEDLAYCSIAELAYLIKNKLVSSTELTKMYIERLKRYNTQLQCVITFTEELALKQAQKVDDEIQKGEYKGPLHGIPYGVKDLLSYPGYKTTWGANPYKDQILDEKAEVIDRLEEAGAVLIAKLTLGALAWGDVWFGGTTKSPWNIEEGSSGSSAGSASATAAGLVAFAIGSETWGSIVSPSTNCGTTGLRPSFGRVSRHGAMTLAWSMDKLGPITRSVEDLAIVFSIIHGKDKKDPTTIDIPFYWNPDLKVQAKRIGYDKNAFEDDHTFKEQDEAVLKILEELGYELVPINLPAIDPEPLAFILTAEAATSFDELTLSGRDELLTRQTKDAWPNFFRSARMIPAVEYIKANRIRTLLLGQMYEMFKENKIEVYLAPSFSKTLLLTNLTGHPAVVVPTGLRPNDDKGKGLPTTITFIGDLYKDDKVLYVAKEYQDKTAYHKNKPPSFS